VGGGGGRAYPDLIRSVGSEVFLLRVSPPQCARLARGVCCFVCVIAYRGAAARPFRVLAPGGRWRGRRGPWRS